MESLAEKYPGYGFEKNALRHEGASRRNPLARLDAGASEKLSPEKPFGMSDRFAALDAETGTSFPRIGRNRVFGTFFGMFVVVVFLSGLEKIFSIFRLHKAFDFFLD